MRRREAILFFVAASLAGCNTRAAARSGLQLVTADDLRRDAAALAAAGVSAEQVDEDYLRLAPKPGPGDPRIIVHSPGNGDLIKAPFVIDLEFVPAPDSVIDVASFTVKYGFLGIDITDRIRDYAEISAKGISAEVDSMPAGKHTVEISIADTLKRRARQRLTLNVSA